MQTSKIFSRIVPAVVAVAMAGCGGGSGNSSGGSATTLTGVASAGPVAGATVCAYQMIVVGKGAQIGNCAKTDSNGAYSLALGQVNGPVVLEMTGGSYTDEATGKTVLPTAPLRTALSGVAGGTVTAVISPLTTMAYDMALAAGGLTFANMQRATAQVEANTGVGNIIGTVPVDALNLPAAASADQKTYALALATLSQYQATLAPGAGPQPDTALTSLETCLASGCTSQIQAWSNAQSAAVSNHPGFAGISLASSFGTEPTLVPGALGTIGSGLVFTNPVLGFMSVPATNILAQTYLPQGTGQTETLSWTQLIYTANNTSNGYMTLTVTYTQSGTGNAALETLFVQATGQTTVSAQKVTVSQSIGQTCSVSGVSNAPTCATLGIFFDRVHGSISFTNTQLQVVTASASVVANKVNGSMGFVPF